MIKDVNNPWENMSNGASRRVDSEIIHEAFWIKDEQGCYGFYIESVEKFSKEGTDIKLKGITLIKRNYLDRGQLFLILNKQSEWQIFLSLCRDMMSACGIYDLNKDMINAVETRLKRWQLFLLKQNGLSMATELQMALFAELACIKDLIPFKGVLDTITAWRGPDKDNQDFNFADLLFEIKSYMTSKGARVIISSPHQLLTNRKPLYIISYGLTISKEGQSIDNILADFDILLREQSTELQQIFEQKLIDYGYIPGLRNEHLLKFVIDSIRCFEITDQFPKIVPHQIASQIIKVNYTIDLELCREHERQLTTIITNDAKYD